MKFSRAYWPVALMTVFAMACTSATEMSDLEIDKATSHVYCDGRMFTGTAWSSDGKTISITCHNGIVDSIVAYHANGKKAVQSMSFRKKGVCYDVTGNPISMERFIECYPELVGQIAKFSFEIKEL